MRSNSKGSAGADIVEVRADTAAEFAAGAADVDAIITSWGLRIDARSSAA